MGIVSRLGFYFRDFKKRIEVYRAYREIERVWTIDSSELTNGDIVSYYSSRACIKDFRLASEKDPLKIKVLARQWGNCINQLDYMIGSYFGEPYYFT